MRQAHAYQKTTLVETMETLRDEFARMDEQFSQLTAVYRQALPPKVLQVRTFTQYNDFALKLCERNKPFQKPHAEYVYMRGRIACVTRQVQQYLLAPLLLVHRVVETSHQQDMKERMREECDNNLQRLESDADWSHLKHAEYAKKIIHREHPFFLGLISCVAIGMDTLLDIDQQLDEYWSGVPSHIKLT